MNTRTHGLARFGTLLMWLVTATAHAMPSYEDVCIYNNKPEDILIEPGDGRAWVATTSGVNEFTAVDGTWTRHKTGGYMQDLKYDGGVLWASARRAGQSLIADLVQHGITGVQGYVAEPYAQAISLPNILYPRYSDGFNLAESFYMASNEIHWNNLVVGDPFLTLMPIRMATV